MNATRTIAALFVASIFPGTPSTFAVGAVQSGDACALLTQAQVSAALGVSVEPGKPIVAGNSRVCGWAPPGGPKIDGKKLTATVMTTRAFDLGKTPMEGIVKEPVSGVGDDAIYITTSGFGTALNVRKGNSAFQLRVGGFKGQQEKDIEKTLAREVLARM